MRCIPFLTSFQQGKKKEDEINAIDVTDWLPRWASLGGGWGDLPGSTEGRMGGGWRDPRMGLGGERCLKVRGAQTRINEYKPIG